MPTSVAHIIGGYAALEAGARGSERPGIFFLVLILVVANLPDFDFLPGMLAGDAGLYHRGPTHSLLAAGLVAAASAWAFGAKLGGPHRVALWTFLAYASHLALDVVLPDPSGGSAGIPLLWPVLPTEIGAAVPGLRVLDDLRSLTAAELQNGFFRGLMSLSGVRIFLLDAVLVLPLVPLSWGAHRLRVRHRRRRPTGSQVGALRPRRRRVAVEVAPRRARVHVGSARVGGD